MGIYILVTCDPNMQLLIVSIIMSLRHPHPRASEFYGRPRAMMAALGPPLAPLASTLGLPS
jgi:hypothetical protein